MAVLDSYVVKAPSDQNILDMFDGEWSSRFPDRLALLTRPGNSLDLFEDKRLAWAQQVLGAFEGLDILELGPLEGAHTYVLHSAGARRITAVEANTRAFLKCLCTKEILKLTNAEFKLGNFVRFLDEQPREYDVVIASGVLYHMSDPLRLLDLIARTTRRAFIWTHYYDHDLISRTALSRRYSSVGSMDYNGTSYDHVVHSYQESLGWSGFCGGSAPTSIWLTRGSLLQALSDVGFTSVHVGFDHPDHPNGPALALCASR